MIGHGRCECVSHVQFVFREDAEVKRNVRFFLQNHVQGMNTKEQVFPERIRQSNLHFDPALKIDSFVITPDILSDKGETFIVSVKTAVDQQQIEAVYYLHPTQPQMPELTYDPEKKLWIGTFDSGKRAQNIFCNGTILAWIKGKNGGVGPRAECSVRVQYTKDKME